MTNKSTVIAAIEGRALPLHGNDIDTDRIIPARFLRAVTFEDLGHQVFRDERFHEDGTAAEHAFNEKRYQGASILIVNNNFGCGSSREHAPQAIKRFGIDALVGESFAEIFAGNCTSLGIPVFTGPKDIIAKLQRQAEEQPDTLFRLDINSKTVTYRDQSIQLEMVESARISLVNGTWDSLDLLLKNNDNIELLYNRLPYIQAWKMKDTG